MAVAPCGEGHRAAARLVPGRPRERSQAMRVRFCAVLAVGVAVVLAAPTALRGQARERQVVVFKDGYVVEGYVKRDTTTIFDSHTGQPLYIPLAGGFYSVDDGPRLIIFSPLQVGPIQP